MKHLVLIACVALAFASPAAAATNPPAAAGANAAKAPFGCEARAGSICYFRIFYPAGRSRDVVLPAGMKQQNPGGPDRPRQLLRHGERKAAAQVRAQDDRRRLQ